MNYKNRKLKRSAIAMALAGTVATPASVQAGADELYASARIGIEYSDTEGTADVGVNSYASRFGAQGETVQHHAGHHGDRKGDDRGTADGQGSNRGAGAEAR